MKINIKHILLGSAILLTGQSCTDLTEKTYDVIPTDQFGSTAAQQAALLGPLYSSLGDYFGRYAELTPVLMSRLFLHVVVTGRTAMPGSV